MTLSCGNWTIICYPQSNSSWFSLRNSVVRKRLNLSKYRIPNPRIGYTKRHNIYSATKLWNTEIPIQLKQSTSLKVFKMSYKNNLKNLMMCISFLYYWILYSSLHLSQLKKTFTAYTVYLHFAAFWLVIWTEMTVTTFSELRESSLASSGSTRTFATPIQCLLTADLFCIIMNLTGEWVISKLCWCLAKENLTLVRPR